MKNLKKIVIYIALSFVIILVAIFMFPKLITKVPYYFATQWSVQVSDDGRYRIEYMDPFLLIYTAINPSLMFVKLVNNKTNEVIEVSGIFDATGAGCCSFIACGISGSNAFGELYDKECWLKKYPGEKPPWEDPDYTKEIRPGRRLFWQESL